MKLQWGVDKNNVLPENILKQEYTVNILVPCFLIVKEIRLFETDEI